MHTRGTKSGGADKPPPVRRGLVQIRDAPLTIVKDAKSSIVGRGPHEKSRHWGRILIALNKVLSDPAFSVEAQYWLIDLGEKLHRNPNAINAKGLVEQLIKHLRPGD